MNFAGLMGQDQSPLQNTLSTANMPLLSGIGSLTGLNDNKYFNAMRGVSTEGMIPQLAGKQGQNMLAGGVSGANGKGR